MNYSRAIFLISDQCRAVLVTYEAKDYADKTMFKTLDPAIKVDDYVVVPTDTRHKMTVCKVAAVDVDPALEDSRQLEWIVGTVDRASFVDIAAQERDAIEKIKAAETRRKRAELRKTLLADAEEEVKALPIYSMKTEAAVE